MTLADTKCKATKLKDGSIYCVPEDLSSCYMEMPRINYRLNGKKYRYFYGFVPSKGLNCGTVSDFPSPTVSGKGKGWVGRKYFGKANYGSFTLLFVK